MKFDKDAYRQRGIIERCIGRLKERPRLAARFEKLGVNFLAMIKAAILERHLRIASSDRA
jgi:hypothetical protein